MTKYWLGKKRKEETKRKISLTKKGKHGSPSTEFKKGHIMTLEIRKKKYLKETTGLVRYARNEDVI